MKRCFGFLVFFIWVHCGVSQPLVHKLISYNNEDYSVNRKLYSDYRIYLERRYDTVFKDEYLKKKFTKHLADEIGMQLEWATNYSNWPEAKQYLTDVIKALMGDKWKPNMVAEINRDEQNNAFMIEDGKVYFHVGMLANSLSEADLASVIGHEYGHYIKEHLYNEFLYRDKLELLGETKRTSSKYLAYEVALESEADDVSFEMMKQSRYDLFAGSVSFKNFLDGEKKFKKTKEYKDYKFERDHPPTELRLSKAEKVAKNTDSAGRKKFIVNESLFYKIKRQAIDECIFLNLEDFHFKACMELCYKQLLLYPDDEFYLFYLNESIRRYITANPEQADEFFLTNFYYLNSQYVRGDNHPKYIASKKINLPASDDKLTNFIFYQYQDLLFNNDAAAISKLPKSYLTNNDTLEFATYREALDFFVGRQEKLHQSSVSFIKKCMDSSVVFTKINSDNIDLNAYNAIYDGEAKKTTENTITIIPLNVYYQENTISMWKMDVDEHSLYSDIINGLHLYNTIPYEVFDFRKLDIKEKVVFTKFLRGLTTCGITEKERKEYYKDAKNVRRDCYKHRLLQSTMLNPEIIPILNKLHLHKIVFSDVWFGEASGGFSYGGFDVVSMSKYVVMSNYYTDLENKQFANDFVTKKTAKLFFQKDSFSTEQLADEIYYAAKMLVEDVNQNRKSVLDEPVHH